MSRLSARTFTLRTACTADGPVLYSFTMSILVTVVAVETAALAIEGPLTFSPSAPGHRPGRAQRPTERRPDDSPGNASWPVVLTLPGAS
jgi:hypothetical protein